MHVYFFLKPFPGFETVERVFRRALCKINISACCYERKSVRNANYYLQGKLRINKEVPSGASPCRIFVDGITLRGVFVA